MIINRYAEKYDVQLMINLTLKKITYSKSPDSLYFPWFLVIKGKQVVMRGEIKFSKDF